MVQCASNLLRGLRNNIKRKKHINFLNINFFLYCLILFHVIHIEYVNFIDHILMVIQNYIFTTNHMNSKISFTQKQKNDDQSPQFSNFPLLYGNFNLADLQSQICNPRSISNQPPLTQNFSQYLIYKTSLFTRYGINPQQMNYLVPQHHPYSYFDGFSSQYYPQYFQKISNFEQNPTTDTIYQVKKEYIDEDQQMMMRNGYNSNVFRHHQHYQSFQNYKKLYGEYNEQNQVRNYQQQQFMSERQLFNLIRKQKVKNYLKKKQKRSYHKRIAYQCRKVVADGRLRSKGRFIKKINLQNVQKQSRNAAKVKPN